MRGWCTRTSTMVPMNATLFHQKQQLTITSNGEKKQISVFAQPNQEKINSLFRIIQNSHNIYTIMYTDRCRHILLFYISYSDKTLSHWISNSIHAHIYGKAYICTFLLFCCCFSRLSKEKIECWMVMLLLFLFSLSYYTTPKTNEKKISSDLVFLCGCGSYYTYVSISCRIRIQI